MKKEERLAKDLCYIFLKRIKEIQTTKNVKRILFCIEGEDFKVDIPTLKNLLKKCISNTPYQSAEVEVLYKYNLGVPITRETEGIYLERIEFEE